jgi:hypothetical protein
MQIFRVSLVFVALLLCSTSVRADGAATVIEVSAVTCGDCWPGADLSPVSFNALITVVPVTGTFYYPWHQNYFTGSEMEVVAISGMFDGQPISLIAPPHGDGSWLNADYSLGYVNFSAGGFDSVLFNDTDFNLLDTATGGGYGTNTPVVWDPVHELEPSSLLLLTVGLIGLALLKRGAS